MNIAFIVNSFPTLSETFILGQITGLLELGHMVDIYARINPKLGKTHPDVDRYGLMSRTCYFNIPLNKATRIVSGLRLLVTLLPHAPLRLLGSVNFLTYGRDALSLKYLHYYVPFIGKEHYYDVIHCHFGYNGDIGVALRRLGVQGKLVTTFYGYDVNAYVQDTQPDVYAPLFGTGDCFLVLSELMKEQVRDLGCDPDKLRKHPLGIDVSSFACNRRAEANEPQHPPTVLTVARLVEKKGLHFGIQAIAELSKTFPDVQYIIAGDGPLKGTLTEQSRELGISDQITLLGWQDADQIRRLYREADVFLLPSVTAQNGDHEGTPTALIEAQAAGLPIVSTRHAGIPEVTLNGESALLVPERDTSTLVASLALLLNRPDLRLQMGRCGRAFVAQHFDLEELNHRLIDLYRSC